MSAHRTFFRPDCHRFLRLLALLVVAAAGIPGAVAAELERAASSGEPVCPRGRPTLANVDRYPSLLTFQLDNDLFAGTDRDYTSGLKLTWVSSEIDRYRSDPCLPMWFNRLSGFLAGLPSNNLDVRNMSFSFGQAIYTPGQRGAVPPPSERPYAGWLYVGVGVSARDDRQLESLELNIGVVGPQAYGEQAQDLIHNFEGYPRFLGWPHQLSNELGVQLVKEWRTRYRLREAVPGAHADFIPHFGVSLGNVATYANAGFDLRTGDSLPNDFGTAAIRPAAESLALPTHSPPGPPGVHGFLTFDARAVARNIFLDGSTFRDSAKVDKRPLVAELALGMSWQWPGGRISYAHTFRSKEYYGQPAAQTFGTVSITLEQP